MLPDQAGTGRTADEDIEDLAGQPKPQHQTNLVVSWIGWVCARKEKKAIRSEGMDEWMTRKW